jgi:GNAT superfamily N-acetyltransferase
MKRRSMEMERDYPGLLAMQRVSWDINFPDREFYEHVFYTSLATAARRGDVYVYEMGDQIVGWLWLDWSHARICHIRHIQVEEDHWGEGMGRAILEDAIALATARERKTLTLTVTKSNRRAMALYQHAGLVLDEDQGDRQRMRIRLSTR